MDLFVTADSHWEARLGPIVRDLVELRSLIHQREYGEGLRGISIVLMCRDPSIKFERRIRLSHKEKQLAFDVMLDLAQMRELTDEERRGVIGAQIPAELTAILSRYSLTDFAQAQFLGDVQGWFERAGWTNPASASGRG